jgi:hypothetical protein
LSPFVRRYRQEAASNITPIKGINTMNVFASGTTGGGSVTLPPERLMLPPTSSPFTAPPATFYGSINGKNNAVHCRARNVNAARTKHIEDVIRGQPTREKNLSRTQIKGAPQKKATNVKDKRASGGSAQFELAAAAETNAAQIENILSLIRFRDRSAEWLRLNNCWV